MKSLPGLDDANKASWGVDEDDGSEDSESEVPMLVV